MVEVVVDGGAVRGSGNVDRQRNRTFALRLLHGRLAGGSPAGSHILDMDLGSGRFAAFYALDRMPGSHGAACASVKNSPCVTGRRARPDARSSLLSAHARHGPERSGRDCRDIPEGKTSGGRL